MYAELLNLAADYYHNLLNAELHINEWVQDRLSIAEPLFRNFSVYLEPSNLFNIFIPFVGIYRPDLLVQLLYVSSVVSAVGSFEKWIYPELRPLWWLRELHANGNAIKSRVALQTHDLSCETSGGLPCDHSMSLTVFLLLGCCIVCMWLSRLYLATEFLHQCILGSYIAVAIWSSCERHLDYLHSRRRSWSVFVVCLLGCLAVAVYFIKLRLELDPHWSVRQAFKWCPEPAYMRHEESPIFLLTRDLGNLMGVALSMPLANLSLANNSSYLRRFAGITVLELINFPLRLYTPKQYGRFAFLAYEFTRNALHYLILIKFLPQLTLGYSRN